MNATTATGGSADLSVKACSVSTVEEEEWFGGNVYIERNSICIEMAKIFTI